MFYQTLNWFLFSSISIVSLLTFPMARSQEIFCCDNTVKESEQTTIAPPALRRHPLGKQPRFKTVLIPLSIPEIQPETPPYQASPNVSIINPSAYGLNWGKLGIGVGYQERTRFTKEDDGVIGIGFAIGNSQENLGLQVGIALTDVSDIFADGSISLKLHRQIIPDLNVALGVQGFATWGETDGGSSLYGVVTKKIRLKDRSSEPLSEINLSLGIGGGQFRSESDIQKGNNVVGVFSSVAVRIIEPVSFIGEWTGQDLTLGFSIVPFRDIPLVLVPAITDVTNTAGDGTRFIFGAGYSFSFK
jgi:hypothetical protein